MSDPLHLALLYGSTREGRFCGTVADWLRAQLALRRDYTAMSSTPSCSICRIATAAHRARTW
jgi:hypothetical protein